jgi:hypothetical protein
LLNEPFLFQSQLLLVKKKNTGRVTPNDDEDYSSATLRKLLLLVTVDLEKTKKGKEKISSCSFPRKEDKVDTEITSYVCFEGEMRQFFSLK